MSLPGVQKLQELQEDRSTGVWGDGVVGEGDWKVGGMEGGYVPSNWGAKGGDSILGYGLAKMTLARERAKRWGVVERGSFWQRLIQLADIRRSCGFRLSGSTSFSPQSPSSFSCSIF
jgi:hypothetical protein